jgi:hypothetical protein
VALADGVAEGASDHVYDDETLYRSVVPSLWKQKSDGEFYLSSQAFADRNRRPSVDRARLCGHDPSYTQLPIAPFLPHISDKITWPLLAIW